MARILTPDQFLKCPRGTVFAFGPKWAFGSMLLLDEIIMPDSNGNWGFYATDPAGVEASDYYQLIQTFERMLEYGESAAVETSSSKYMSYDGDAMDVFLVFEEADWRALTEMARFSG